MSYSDNLFEPEPLFVPSYELTNNEKLKQYDEEADLLDAVKEWCDLEDYYAIRINDSMHKGYSDLFIVVQGRLVVAELKDKTGQPTMHQLKFIEKVQCFGGIGGVCRSIAEVEDLCDEARWY